MGLLRSNETKWWNKYYANEHNMVKNYNWQKADQLAIYKHGQGVELGSTKKQLQLSAESRTWTCDLQSPAP